MANNTDDVYVALLRGVNVGGHHKLPMKKLSELCEKQGCTAVQTYIQSGNVVFRAPAKTAQSFSAKLKAEIHKELGFESPVILRTAAQWRAVALHNPYLTPKVDTKFLHVTFLMDEPKVSDAVQLNPPCAGDEAFSLRGREIYFYLPNGVGRSKLAAYAFDKVLKTTGSMRNWQTVQKLLALTEEARLSG